MLSDFTVSPLKVTMHVSIFMFLAFCWHYLLLHRKEGRLCPSTAPFGEVYV